MIHIECHDTDLQHVLREEHGLRMSEYRVSAYRVVNRIFGT